MARQSPGRRGRNDWGNRWAGKRGGQRSKGIDMQVGETDRHGRVTGRTGEYSQVAASKDRVPDGELVFTIDEKAHFAAGGPYPQAQ